MLNFFPQRKKIMLQPYNSNSCLTNQFYFYNTDEQIDAVSHENEVEQNPSDGAIKRQRDKEILKVENINDLIEEIKNNILIQINLSDINSMSRVNKKWSFHIANNKEFFARISAIVGRPIKTIGDLKILIDFLFKRKTHLEPWLKERKFEGEISVIEKLVRNINFFNIKHLNWHFKHYEFAAFLTKLFESNSELEQKYQDDLAEKIKTEELIDDIKEEDVNNFINKNPDYPRQWFVSNAEQLEKIIELNYKSGCKILPKIPGEIKFLKNLTTLAIDGISAKAIGVHLVNLKNLSVSSADELVLQQIGKIKSLESLHLGLWVPCEIPEEIVGLKNLLKISFEFYFDDPEKDSPPDDKLKINLNRLATLDSLTELHFTGEFGISSLPEEIGNLSNLKVLSMEGTKISELPEKFWELTNLENLKIDSNELKSVSENIGNLSKLKKLSLWLWWNEFKIPERLWSLTKLEKLKIGGAKLKFLSDEIANLSNLKKLSLFRSKIKTLPDKLWTMTNLEKLNFDENGLLWIPCDIKNLTNLKQLTIDEDQDFVFLPPTKVWNSLPNLNLDNTMYNKDWKLIRQSDECLEELEAAAFFDKCFDNIEDKGDEVIQGLENLIQEIRVKQGLKDLIEELSDEEA
jgi:Leucine-rich repeat (LRR) protein